MEQIREQRKAKRFLAQDRTLVRVSSSPGILFHIIDIGSGGLAFRYLGEDELDGLPSELDIVYGDKFTLGRLPVVPVNDCAIEYGYLPMRRKSLRFGDLTPWQQAELDHCCAAETFSVYF
ncbi:MAG: hypothetical protein P8X63_03075 [Desulfuromonadaceae bacterium]